MGIKFSFAYFVASLLVIVFCGFMVSCSDSDPEIVDAVSYVVLDYSTEQDYPSARISAFAETSSDVHRVERIQLQCMENNYKWICYEPLIFGTEKRKWAGFSDFYVPLTESIPKGMYELDYYDAQENVVTRKLNLNYDPSYLTMNASQFVEAEKFDFREEIVIYNEAGIIVYYGNKKNSWKNDSIIFSSNRSSSYYRTVYFSRAGSLVCIMPPVYKNKQSNENK